jgi:hypothetical protein
LRIQIALHSSSPASVLVPNAVNSRRGLRRITYISELFPKCPRTLPFCLSHTSEIWVVTRETLSMKRQHILTSLIALTLALTVLAHGHENAHGNHSPMDMHPAATNNTTPINDRTTYYFAYELHKGWLYLHVLTMVLGWVIVMPVCKESPIVAPLLHRTNESSYNVITRWFTIPRSYAVCIPCTQRCRHRVLDDLQ